jgi:hypothetical protein
MEEVSQKDFDKAAALPEEKIDNGNAELTESEFNKLLEEIQNPVMAQQHLAVKIKSFLDKRIREEMSTKGVLSDHTRRWVESYNSILEKIQKSLSGGDKTVNLHLHAVSHSQIAAKMREAVKHQNDNNN